MDYLFEKNTSLHTNHPERPHEMPLRDATGEGRSCGHERRINNRTSQIEFINNSLHVQQVRLIDTMPIVRPMALL
jgi:hypothetical protein